MTSLEFIKHRILSGQTGLDFTEEEIDKSVVIPFDDTATFSQAKNTAYDEITKGFPKPEVVLSVSKNEDWDYFSSEVSEHDGTMLFTIKSLEALRDKIKNGWTYDISKAPKDFAQNFQKYIVHMVVGDIVIMRKLKKVVKNDGFAFPGEEECVAVPIKWSCELR